MINYQLCEKIREYCLQHRFEYDNNVFTYKSKEGLGKYFFDNIISNVCDSDKLHIEYVTNILTLRQKPITNEAELYKCLFSLFGFNKLPYNIFKKSMSKFNSILNDYQRVCNKISKRILEINNELIQTQKNIEQLIHKCNTKKTIQKDLADYERKLVANYHNCNLLNTEKEMMQFSNDYMDKRLSEFCDINDPNSITEKIKKESFQYSKSILKQDDALLSLKIYRDVISITESNLDMNIFFYRVKIIQIYGEIQEEINAKLHYGIDSESDKHNQIISNELKQKLDALIKPNELYIIKQKDKQEYLTNLQKIILDNSIIEKIKSRLETGCCLHKRKDFLLSLLSIFENEQYEIFNNIIPVQLEGLFSDYLLDGTIFKRFTDLNIYHNAVLREKIAHIKNDEIEIYPEAEMYFKFYFNNLIRNRVAHGELRNPLNQENHIVFSHELLLDLNLLTYMMVKTSESDKMYYTIKEYEQCKEKNRLYGSLFADLNGERIHITPYSIYHIKPIQFVYWITNPYYENIYESVDDSSSLLNLRMNLLSKEFWSFAIDKLEEIKQHSLKKPHDSFGSIIKMLIPNINNDVKDLLKQANKLINEIKNY